MNKLFFTLFCGCLIFILSSCSTSTTFTVYGNPGTEILTPSRTSLATIDNSGMAKIKNPDDNYYAFLISHRPGTNNYVPFALDYKDKSYAGEKTVEITGMVIAGAGLAAAIGGLICVAAKAGGEMVLGAGLGASLVGVGIGGPAGARRGQTSHEYHYKYLPTQKTNEDIRLSTSFISTTSTTIQQARDVTLPIENEKPKEVTIPTKTPKTDSSLSLQSINSLFGDYGKLTAGTYTGNGTLLQNSSVVKSLDNMMVNITRVSNNEVDLNVTASGYNFFQNAIRFSVAKNGDGAYRLSSETFPSTTINIDIHGNLTLYSPDISIEGNTYTLKVNANQSR